MALAAQIVGQFGGKPFGMNHGGIAFVGEIEQIAPPGVPVYLDMLLAGTVAGFAGDPEFSDTGVARYPRIEKMRPAAGTVAAHAVFVPHLRRLDLIVGAKKAVLVGNPALLSDEPGEGKEKEGAPFARAEPIDLLVVGAGGQHGAPLHPLGLILRAHEIPVEVAPTFAELGDPPCPPRIPLQPCRGGNPAP